jgi:hypothetical protein
MAAIVECRAKKLITANISDSVTTPANSPGVLVFNGPAYFKRIV